MCHFTAFPSFLICFIKPWRVLFTATVKVESKMSSNAREQGVFYHNLQCWHYRRDVPEISGVPFPSFCMNKKRGNVQQRLSTDCPSHGWRSCVARHIWSNRQSSKADGCTEKAQLTAWASFPDKSRAKRQLTKWGLLAGNALKVAETMKDSPCSAQLNIDYTQLGVILVCLEERLFFPSE